MASVKITLDRRAQKRDGTYPVKAVVSHAGRTALIPLDISVRAEQWDAARRRVVQHANKANLNAYIATRQSELERALLALREQGKVKGKTATQVRDMLLQAVTPAEEEPVTFRAWYEKFALSHDNARTRAIYLATLVQVDRYDENASQRKFEDIGHMWLTGFFSWMAATSPSVNARNIHLRNIRAAFNAAIDEGLTDFYPFRRYKIRPVVTRKRNLKPDALRALFDAQVPEWQQKYIDVFKLIFLLIGINTVDLLTLPAGADAGGRIEYSRRKTKRFYSIKVEPEAAAIIDRYRGEKNLLNVTDGCVNYRSFALRLNKNLGAIMPGVTTYYARHSWATIAAALDIPDDTIALALGHAGANSTTAIYIQRDRRKVDAANRRVIDWVLYGKK